MAETIWCLFVKNFICPSELNCYDGPCPHMTSPESTVIVEFDKLGNIESIVDKE